MNTRMVILQAINEIGDRPFSQREVAEKVGVSQQLVSHHMKQLQNEGVLWKEEGHHGKWHITTHQLMFQALMNVKTNAPVPLEVPVPRYMADSTYEKLKFLKAYIQLEMKESTQTQRLVIEGLREEIKVLERLVEWFARGRLDLKVFFGEFGKQSWEAARKDYGLDKKYTDLDWSLFYDKNILNKYRDIASHENLND